MNTFDSIVADLTKLGVQEGDTYLLRISYKAIGKIEGGPKTFLDAMLSVIGPKGTIILTAFPKKNISQLRFFHRRNITSKEKPAKPFTGIMPIMAMTYENAKISEKLEFPFVVIGKNADYLTENHTHDKEDYWLLREAMTKFDCKCLRIGGEPLFGSTHLAVTDVFKEQNVYMRYLKKGIYVYENNRMKWYDTDTIMFCKNAFFKYTDYITSQSRISEGYVGNGKSVITSMMTSYSIEKDLFSQDIHNLLCNDPNCPLCQTSYSFSNSSNVRYISHILAHIFTRNIKQSGSLLRNAFLHALFAKKIS